MYKEALYSTFKSKVEVEDIFVVPDYSTILSECGDPNLSCYAKGENTQLQFTFVAVDVSNDYPTGVKVNYRAYSSDKRDCQRRRASSGAQAIHLSSAATG